MAGAVFLLRYYSGHHHEHQGDLQERRIRTRRRHYQCASWSELHGVLRPGLAEIRETIGPKIADKTFEFWNNPDDALYDNL